jgi:hypothetical protein
MSAMKMTAESQKMPFCSSMPRQSALSTARRRIGPPIRLPANGRSPVNALEPIDFDLTAILFF